MKKELTVRVIEHTHILSPVHSVKYAVLTLWDNLFYLLRVLLLNSCTPLIPELPVF